MTDEKKIYLLSFSDKDELKKFAGAPPEDIRIRCVFKKKNQISVAAGKKGFCKLISEGMLPDEIGVELNAATNEGKK